MYFHTSIVLGRRLIGFDIISIVSSIDFVGYLINSVEALFDNEIYNDIVN